VSVVDAGFAPLGYFPKRIAKPEPRWPLAANVEEICSVSNCVSVAPSGWMEPWRHNCYFFFDSEDLAAEIAATDAEGGFEIFAYAVLRRRFGLDGATPVTLCAPDVVPTPASYRLIGYDVVECWQMLEAGAPIGCSPLSCNAMAREIAVNRFCLIDAFEDARDIAHRFGAQTDGVEPGPYYLFEVWRRIA
jgi:hypothetical protein